MKVLITGASGHLGYATVREAIREGHEVAAMVRETSNLKGLEGTGAEIRYGDVQDKESVRAAAQNCEAIIHQAAVFRTDTDNPEEIIQPAVEGTRNVLEVANEASIGRVVYTSSIIAIGMSGSPDQILDGNTWNQSTPLPYAEAKTRSEQVAHELARELGIELMVFCPSGIIGPGDYRVTPTHGLLLAMLKGAMPARRGGINLVSVFDVARLHVQALTRGTPFTRYVAGNRDNITYDRLGEILEQISGSSLPTPPDGDPGMALYSYYDITETCKDFDYDPLSAAESVKSAVQWFIDTGVYEG